MLLHSWSFCLGFLVFLLLYHCLRRSAQNLLLLLGSYLFVAAFDWRFLGMLWAYTLVNYLGARLMDRARGRARRGWPWTQAGWRSSSISTSSWPRPPNYWASWAWPPTPTPWACSCPWASASTPS